MVTAHWGTQRVERSRSLRLTCRSSLRSFLLCPFHDGCYGATHEVRASFYRCGSDAARSRGLGFVEVEVGSRALCSAGSRLRLKGENGYCKRLLSRSLDLPRRHGANCLSRTTKSNQLKHAGPRIYCQNSQANMQSRLQNRAQAARSLGETGGPTAPRFVWSEAEKREGCV